MKLKRLKSYTKRHSGAVSNGLNPTHSTDILRSADVTPVRYFDPTVNMIAHDLFDGCGNSPDHIVGQFVPFSPDPENPNWFDEFPVPFQTTRGIGCWVNPETGNNVTTVPAVECVLIANLRYSDFPKSSYRGKTFIRDYLVNELMRQFDDTYTANERHTFLARSQYEEKVFVWPDCNRVAEGMTFAIAFAVPHLNDSQLPELRKMVQEKVFFVVAQMLLRLMIGIG